MKARLLSLHVVKLNFLFLLFLSGGYAHAQNLTGHFKIYDTRSKTTSSVQAIIDYVNDHDVLFFGEEHNDSIAHFLQDTLYTMLVSRYGNVTLSMEMFERDCQVVLDEYVNGFITETQLVKEGRGWPNYSDYAPMVNTAKEHKLKVVAANAPRRYVSMVNRKGLSVLDELNHNSKENIAPLPIDTSNPPYEKKFAALMGQGHDTKSNLYYAQSLWDATMAHSIYTSWKQNKNAKIFQLNGRFHSDERLGTVHQLQHKNNRIRIGTLSCFRADDFQNPDWTKYHHLADFVILTDPNVPTTY